MMSYERVKDIRSEHVAQVTEACQFRAMFRKITIVPNVVSLIDLDSKKQRTLERSSLHFSQVMWKGGHLDTSPSGVSQYVLSKSSVPALFLICHSVFITFSIM